VRSGARGQAGDAGGDDGACGQANQTLPGSTASENLTMLSLCNEQGAMTTHEYVDENQKQRCHYIII
jgi:hypothetical protein